MPINKFGQYLNENNHSSPFGDKRYSDVIECDGKRLQHVQRGFYKTDSVNKEQLDDVFVQCLKKIKANTKNLEGTLIRLKALEERFTTPIAIASPSQVVLPHPPPNLQPGTPLIPQPSPKPDKKKKRISPNPAPGGKRNGAISEGAAAVVNKKHE